MRAFAHGYHSRSNLRPKLTLPPLSLAILLPPPLRRLSSTPAASPSLFNPVASLCLSSNAAPSLSPRRESLRRTSRPPVPTQPTFPTPPLRASSIIFVRARKSQPRERERERERKRGNWPYIAGLREVYGRKKGGYSQDAGRLGKRAPPFTALRTRTVEKARDVRHTAALASANSRLMSPRLDTTGSFAPVINRYWLRRVDRN